MLSLIWGFILKKIPDSFYQKFSITNDRKVVETPVEDEESEGDDEEEE